MDRRLRALAYALFLYGRAHARTGVGLDLRAMSEIRRALEEMYKRAWITVREAREVVALLVAVSEELRRSLRRGEIRDADELIDELAEEMDGGE